MDPDYDNPLFGSTLQSPSPAAAGSYNPVWSPASPSWDRSVRAPGSVFGMRRLAAMPTSQLAATASLLDEVQATGGAGAEGPEADLHPHQQPVPSPGPPSSFSIASRSPILPSSAASTRIEAVPPFPIPAAPPAVILGAASQGASGRPEEQAFAEVLGAVMRRELDAADALTQYASICRQQAAHLREAASSQLQRAARYMTLRDAAAELDGEASTWHLMWHLHGIQSRDFPGGKGGNFVEGAGLHKTVRQQVSDLLFQDAALNRCARTVAWLEFLAGEALDREPGVHFSATDGVWRETRSRLAAGAVGVAGRAGGAFGGGGRDAGGASALLVTELDPDAPTRQRRRLDVENAKGEEMLTAHMWKLIRAGRVSAAQRLCEDVGQPWRAASLAGAGAQGPVPLAAAADEADELDSGWEQPEDMAGEVEAGPGVRRALWRWACLQLAERVGAAAEQAGGGLHEAAVYAALSGHLARVLPVCTSWEDVCWAHLRCWLDLCVDAQLGMQPDAELALPGCQAQLAELAGGGEVCGEGLEVAKGGWPLDRLRASMPPSFQAVLQAADGSTAAGGVSTAASATEQRYRGLQRALILDHINQLVCGTLAEWVLQGSGGSRGPVRESPTRGAQPACPPSLMRFAAHLALSLWALDIASVPEDGRASAAYDELHDVLHKVLQVYIIHLIDSGVHDLVPLYCCHLRAGLRHMTYQIFFEQLLAQSSMESCRTAYRLADTWFEFWEGKGDVAPQEMASIAIKATGRSRYEVLGGPLQRARFARWLCFAPATLRDALRHVNLLCREFALGGSGGIAAATLLLTQQLPSALGTSLEEFLASLEEAGGEGAAGGSGAQEEGEEEREELAAQATELRCWWMYYEYEAEFGDWQEQYSETMAAVQQGQGQQGGVGVEEEAGELQRQTTALAQRTLPLLQAMLGLLREGWLESLVAGGGVEGDGATEVVLAVGPDRGLDAEAGVQSATLPLAATLVRHLLRLLTQGGEAFPTFSSQHELESAAAELQQALKRAGEAQRGLHFVVAPAPPSMEGMVTLAAKCGGVAALDACVVLLSLAVKGCLPGAEGVGPLAVVNVDAPPSVSAALCRCMCFPRVVLKCGALREALAFMGNGGDEGRDLPQLVAGSSGGGSSNPMAMYFSQAELQELLQYERAATVLQMRNDEEAQRTKQRLQKSSDAV